MVSLGCPKNTVDGEVLLGDLFRSGFEVTEAEEADAIVVNTCAFIDDAKSESVDAIMEVAALKEQYGDKKLIVTGCLAQRYSDTLAEEAPEIDLVLGFQEYGALPGALRNLMGLGEVDAADYQQRARVQVGDSTVPFRPEWDRHRLTPKHYAYLRVAEGCNHACTFCAIPGFRGKFRSKPWQAVLEEAEYLVKQGVVELNLIAEDTNQYGQDRRDGKGLAELLQELGKLEGLQWIRLLYCYPSYFSEELIDEIASNPKVCKYIDMPLQHIDNFVLLSMNRPARDHTETLLAKLRERIPDLALRTTFITGFPGETEQQHQNLVDFCQESKFERMGAFAYSEEDGTPAAEMEGQTDPEVRQYRRDELISLQQQLGEQWARGMVGKEIDVLVDGYTQDGELIGRTQWDAPDIDHMVFLGPPAEGSGVPPLEVGQMRRCVVDAACTFDLEAHPIA